MKFLFKLFNLEVAYISELKFRKINNKLVVGYTNRTIDGKFIVTLDYDDIFSEWHKTELKSLQDLYKLSDFYIFQTNKGFHAVCFDKLKMKDYLNILELSSSDYNYKTVPLMSSRKMWVLRLTEKNRKIPKLIYILKSKNKKYEQSYAHANLINNILNTNIRLKNHDGITKLILAEYYI